MGIAPHRSTDCNISRADRIAEDIALALMGVGDLPDAVIAEGAIWDRTDTPCIVGRAAIQSARTAVPAPRTIRVDVVVTHGKAGAVSGHYSPDGRELRLFCNVVRFRTAARQEIARLVSFERRERCDAG